MHTCRDQSSCRSHAGRCQHLLLLLELLLLLLDLLLLLLGGVRSSSWREPSRRQI
jgi:hypothetical protein